MQIVLDGFPPVIQMHSSRSVRFHTGMRERFREIRMDRWQRLSMVYPEMRLNGSDVLGPDMVRAGDGRTTV